MGVFRGEFGCFESWSGSGGRFLELSSLLPKTLSLHRGVWMSGV